MLVDKSVIEGLEPVVEGFKIFNNDWAAKPEFNAKIFEKITGIK
jgi:hypothetical protein